MVNYYSLTSIFFAPDTSAPKVEVKLIDVSLYNMTRKMKQLAADYVCNAVGKNNFIDTTSGEYADLPVNACPLGYVIKHGDQYKRGQIDIWFNSSKMGFTGSYTVSKLIGTFAVIPAESTSKGVEKDFKEVVNQLKDRIATARKNLPLDVSCINMDEEEEEPEDIDAAASDSDEECEQNYV